MYVRKTFSTLKTGSDGTGMGNLAAPYPEIMSRGGCRKNKLSKDEHVVLVGTGVSPQKPGHGRGVNYVQRNKMIISSAVQELQYSEQQQSLNIKN